MRSPLTMGPSARGFRSLCALASFGLLATASLSASAPAFVVGMDVSALPVFEKLGTTYRTEAGEAKDALIILREAGTNCFRLRLFVDPNHVDIVTNDLEYTLALAKRAHATGATVLLNLHYSDTWADPAKQYVPKAWEGLDLAGLEAKVEAYTRDVFTRFLAEGVSPEYVQLGNEITNGMLWPIGKVEFAEAENTPAWERLGVLQRAAYRGLAAAYGERPLPRRILHIESTGNVPRTRWYLENAQAQGIPFDVVGLSYYPEWHGTLADLADTLEAAATQTDKPVMVVETSYPWKDDEHWGRVAKPELIHFPKTPDGQRIFIQAVADVVASVSHGQGQGVFWWYPECRKVNGLHAWLGGSGGLFDDQGRLLPAAQTLGDFAR